MNKQEELNNTFEISQSLQVISEMIEVSKNKIKKDGILFILWGWVLLYKSVSGFLERKLVMTYQTKRFLQIFGLILFIAALAITLYYIVWQRKRVQTYIGISLRYVWISFAVAMILTNLVLWNVMSQISFELQHPLQMILMAFAVTVTGGILRYRLIILGGIAFGILAYIASRLELEQQLLVEAIAWSIAFIVPGHVLFASRNK